MPPTQIWSILTLGAWFSSLFLVSSGPSSLAVGADSAAGRQPVATVVPHDLAALPPAEAVDALGRATGFPLRLVASGRVEAGQAADSPVVAADGPTFWDEFDRVIRANRLAIVPRWETGGKGRLDLEPGGRMPSPSTVRGAFWTGLVGLDQIRRVVYDDPTAEVPDSMPRLSPGPGGGRVEAPTWGHLNARLLVLTEPRPVIDVQLARPPRIDEATDDQGRSLVAAPAKFDFPDLYAREKIPFGLNVRLPLRLVDPPGRSIRRLRGVVPLVTWVLNPEPLEVPLPAEPGRPSRGAGVELTVVTRPPKTAANAVVIELRPVEPDQPLSSALAMYEAGPGRLFLKYEEQFALIDATGRQIAVTVATDRLNPRGDFQVTLTPRPAEANRIPARLRFRGLVWARTEVPFDFTEVPLP